MGSRGVAHDNRFWKGDTWSDKSHPAGAILVSQLTMQFDTLHFEVEPSS